MPERKMTTVEIIRHYGYPVEVRNVSTADGYILELHRIPYGINESRGSDDRPVVFLQHGFIGSSAVWVTNGPSKSAGFMFADAGFDVWMGNARGNKYSRYHETLTRDDDQYWAFTWDEIAKHDLPAMIRYVLNVTNHGDLHYVGYSEGTLTMFAKLATDRRFRKNIRTFFALGPIGTLAHIQGLIHTAATQFMLPLKLLSRVSKEFGANDSFLRKVSKGTCKLDLMTSYCESFMYQLTGPYTKQFNQTRMPVYLTHLPSGTSMANLLHWAQMARSGKTQMFDFGSDSKNEDNYGTAEVPVYNLSLVNAPVYLYWSNADWLADGQDVKDGLVDVIPEQYIIQNNELPDFNHFDFIWGINAPRDVYVPIIDIIVDDERKLRLIGPDDD